MGINKPFKMRIFPLFKILAPCITSNKNALWLHNTTTLHVMLEQ